MTFMKKTILLFVAAFLLSGAAFADDVPAFPGAEGHGRYVTGGRGGVVKHVTNLNDSGTGSLRAAVSGSAKKIVVFDVAGIIELKSDLKIGDNTTIAGQTAPSPGITLRYRTILPGANNIIRFIRIRRGEEKDVNDGADAIWQRGVANILLDHCSFSWSIDEIASFYDNRNFTMQWCTIGEALANPGHTKGEHSYGGIWGGKNASFHHNFLCHMQNRVPRFCGARYAWDGYDKTKYANPIQAEIVDFRNCVMYNWGNGNGCYGGTGGGHINIVNNYYKAGPATANKTRVTQISVANSSNAESSPYMGYTSRYYINGNYVTAAGSSAENYDWKGVKYDDGTYIIDGEYCCTDAKHLYGDNVTYYKNASGTDCVRIKMESPVPQGEVTTHSAQNAYNKVLAHAGASLYRDAVDTRYMDEARNGTTTYIGSATVTGDGKPISHRAGIIDFVKDQGVYTLDNGKRPDGFDTDNDGIPNVWESANGLNPDDASDAALFTLDSEKKWYSNLEVYLNSLVEDIMKDGNNDAQTAVDEYYPACTKVEIPTEGGQTNPTEDDTDATVTWAFDNGQEGQTAQFADGISASFESNSVVLGKNLSYNGAQAIATFKETKIRAMVPNESSANDDNSVTFTFTTKSGYKFQATDISFYATRFGTDGGKLDASWKDAGGTTVLTTGQTPNRNNGDPAFTEYSFKNVNGTPTEGECSLIISIYALGQVKDDGTNNLKDYGLGNIKVTGKLTDGSSGINHTYSNTEVSRTYYNIKGQRIAAPLKGVNIIVEKMANGTTQSRKVILK